MRLTKPARYTGVILLIIFALGLWVMASYNSLVASKANVDNSWASVETQYQRRLDLIGNLVASVKGAQGQEQTVFGKIADARSAYNNATTTSAKAQAASQVETNLALIPRLQEAYPDLKSNAQVTALMTELSGTENGILGARDNYNKTATEYNVSIQRFPRIIWANTFGFQKQALFKADAAAATAPQVKFQ